MSPRTRRLRQLEIIEKYYDRWQRDYERAEKAGYVFSPVAVSAFRQFLAELKPDISKFGRVETIGGRRVASRERRDLRLPPALRSRIGTVGPSAKGRRRFIKAVETRFMPEVRRQVYAVIDRAMSRLGDEQFQKVISLQRKSGPLSRRELASYRVEAREETARKYRPFMLAAEYIRAFYPLFGTNTTAEHVRKSVRTSVKSPTR